MISEKGSCPIRDSRERGVTHENDLPAKKEKKKQGTWFQEKNEDKCRQKGVKKQEKKRKEKVDSIRPLSRGLFIDGKY